MIFIMMTSSITSRCDVKVCLLYSCLNEIVTFSAIQVTVFYQSSPNLVHICSLPQHRNLFHRSKVEIAITPLIFELERRTKSQNVGNDMAYFGVRLNFRYNARFKNAPESQNGGHSEIFEIFHTGSF